MGGFSFIGQPGSTTQNITSGPQAAVAAPNLNLGQGGAIGPGAPDLGMSPQEAFLRMQMQRTQGPQGNPQGLGANLLAQALLQRIYQQKNQPMQPGMQGPGAATAPNWTAGGPQAGAGSGVMGADAAGGGGPGASDALGVLGQGGGGLSGLQNLIRGLFQGS